MKNTTNLEFRFKEIDETRNYLLDEIKHNDLMSEKYKKTCKYLNYVEHLLILFSTVTGCLSTSAFASLVCVPVVISVIQQKEQIFVQWLHELKSINQLLRNRRRISMIK